MFEKEESRTISRVLYSCLFKNARHLSTPDVTIRLYRSTLRRMARAGRPQAPVYVNFQRSDVRQPRRHGPPWALTPRSHPYRHEWRRLFSSTSYMPLRTSSR